MPVCKGHLPVTETNRTGYVLGGPRERERERPRVVQATEAGGGGKKERRVCLARRGTRSGA